MVALPVDSEEAVDELTIGTAPIGRTAPETGTETRPTLIVVQKRRSWTAVIIGIISILIFGGMLGAAVFHTQLAERQLRIDRLERAVVHERERFDELRHRRAELRSPAYLDTVADELNMIRGTTGAFLRVTPERLAMQLAAAGAIDGTAAEIVDEDDPLDQFRDVKAVSEGQP